MPNLNMAHDNWKTKQVDSIEERKEVGRMSAKGKFKTQCNREINIEITFHYKKTGKQTSYLDTSKTEFFMSGEKLSIDHPLLERYADEIDDLMDELVSERIAEEA